MKRKNKGFTLIELLAVIVILGLLMAIAIPSVTKYITESRKKTLTTTLGNYISALVNEVNDLAYTFTGQNTIYAVPIECIALERGGTNPFGHWYQANNAYFAYVLVQYDDTTSKYIYGFTFKDSAGYGLYPTIQANINEKGKQIKTGYDLNKPKTGELTSLTTLAKWQESGFKLDSTTHLQVLVSESDGQTGNGTSTCTLQQKGDNYSQVEEEKQAELEATEGTEGTLVALGSSSTNPIYGHTSLQRSSIEEIHILDNKRVPSNAIEWWDASSEKNLSIKAWILDEDGDSLYELYIGQKGGVTAPADSSFLFSGFSKATIMDLKKLDTSKVESMKGMFFLSRAVLELDLSTWDTSNVTNMYGFFAYADAMTKLDISGFDTSKVTDMSLMFGYLTKIESFDLSHFDTSKVITMQSMFLANEAKSLDLSSFDTTKVTNMSAMFSDTTGLSKLDISNFNTSNVTDMDSMFADSSIGTLTLGTNFNTSKVTDMSFMFYGSPNINTTFVIRNSSVDYTQMFLNAATSSTARINVNYTSSTSSRVTSAVATKSSNSKVYKYNRV